MNIHSFLDKIYTTKSSEHSYPVSLEVFEDEDTTRLQVESVALVGHDKNISGFKIKTSFHNNYAHSNECPCYLELEFLVDVPSGSLSTWQQEFVISFQDRLIQGIINNKYTDDLTDDELQAFEQWDRKALLNAPESLEEVVSYLELSNWAASCMERHTLKWIHGLTWLVQPKHPALEQGFFWGRENTCLSKL